MKKKFNYGLIFGIVLVLSMAAIPLTKIVYTKSILIDAAGDFYSAANQLQVQMYGNENRPVQVDARTWSIQTISYEHHEIHSGSHFFWEEYTTLSLNGTWDICIQTPDTTEETHFVAVISSTLGSTFEIFEGSTITWDGTNEIAYNSNRTSSHASSWENFETDPTVTTDGTLLASAQLGSASNPNNGVAGASGRDRELILKTNTSYTLRVTSLNNSNVVTVLLEWYEHTPKE